VSETVVVIDYGSGNLRSAAKALERAAAERGLARRVHVSDKPAELRAADRIVLPGVGAFADCRAGIEAIPGMREAIEAAIAAARPFLGICVGMQLMAEAGLEYGRHPGFGWLKGEVRPIAPGDSALKIPHMGWNALQLTAAGRRHPLLGGIEEGAYVYFVHSYHMMPADADLRLATVAYGEALTAAVARENLAGVQFHPEKSQRVGLKVLANFLEWQP